MFFRKYATDDGFWCNVDNPMISHHQFYEWFKTHGRFMQVYFSGFPEDCLSTVPRGEVPKRLRTQELLAMKLSQEELEGWGMGSMILKYHF